MKDFKPIINAALSGFLISSSVALAAGKGYLTLGETEVEVDTEQGKKTLELELKTRADIPADGKSGAFGYGAITDGGNNVMVLVTHLPIDDSSFEDPDSGFHTHVLDLKKPTGACEGAQFEVDLDNSGKNKAFDADYKWAVKGNEASVKGVPVEDLGDAGVEQVVSFTLKPILNAGKKPTNLCVHVVDQE